MFIAAHKLLLGKFWGAGLIVSQLVISGISGIYFYKLARILFPGNHRISLLATVIFAVFPLTLWWVHTFCTEIVFQSLLIIAIYYFVLSIRKNKFLPVVLSATFFSIVFLTKSHILLFTPFIALAYFLYIKPVGRGALFALCYAAISLASTLPFGLYNLQKHGEYVMSSNGLKFHFYTGNSDFGYASIVDVPPKNSTAYIQLKDFNLASFNGAVHDSILALPHPLKQQLYFEYALNWIKNNPVKFAELKAHNLFRFLFPGVSRKQYPFMKWLSSFIVSLPIYIFGYIGIGAALRKDLKSHFFILGLFVTMLIFSVAFYTQNRFRTITLEPFYIIYASYGFLLMLGYFSDKPGEGSASAN